MESEVREAGLDGPAGRGRRRGVGAALALVLLGMGVLDAVWAAAPGTAEAPAAGPRPAARAGAGFLWTVGSGAGRVHLLGSIHVGAPELYPLAAAVESAFARSATLVLETALDGAAQQQAALKLMQAAAYPPGETLERHLDAATLALLQAHLQRMGTPLASVNAIRPWLLATIFTLGEIQRLGYQPALGIDRHFAAKAEGRRVLALETIDEQVALFADMPERLQQDVLKETLTRMHELDGQMREAIAAWREGDAARMEALVVAPIRTGYPELFRRLFLERNRRMAAAVEGYLKAGGEHFLVVGCGHVVGAGGIVDLLQARGYAVVRP